MDFVNYRRKRGSSRSTMYCASAYGKENENMGGGKTEKHRFAWYSSTCCTVILCEYLVHQR